MGVSGPPWHVLHLDVGSCHQLGHMEGVSFQLKNWDPPALCSVAEHHMGSDSDWFCLGCL